MCVCTDDLTCVFVMLREGAFACAYTCVCVVSVCVRVGGGGVGQFKVRQGEA